LTICFCLAASSVWAQAASKPVQFTGNEWFKLNKAARVKSITTSIRTGGERGIIIKKSPKFYSARIDAFYKAHPDLMKEPVAAVLKTLIVMEYDWEQEGVDKDALAKKILGEELYLENKTRLGK
ncbi:MAG: hypothetical protein WCT15_03250, partial [Candidatus Omnitrophota bacterium]